jgi:catechol 2,3-dioxygenase-like lactoylglutathione lyase family enzyme
METTKLYRGRLIDHLQLVVRDIDASKRFYRALLEALDISVGGEGPTHMWADELFISTAAPPFAQGNLTGPTHFAFQAKSRDDVERVYKLGLQAGGKDNGAPGERPYHPGYYAAFLLDPDGNNVEVVFHGVAKKSADAVVITF